MSPTQRNLRSIILTIALVAFPAMVTAVPVSAATTTCSSVWGSLEKLGYPSGEQGLQFVASVRSGQHPCYDRVVVDLRGNDSGPVGYSVRYVDAVTKDVAGETVSLAGQARLEVLIGQGNYDHGSQSPAYNPADPAHLVDVTGYRTLRQIGWADTVAGDHSTKIGIGVRARLPMRAFLLPSVDEFYGQRLVIDIAHHW